MIRVDCYREILIGSRQSSARTEGCRHQPGPRNRRCPRTSWLCACRWRTAPRPICCREDRVRCPAADGDRGDGEDPRGVGRQAPGAAGAARRQLEEPARLESVGISSPRGRSAARRPDRAGRAARVPAATPGSTASSASSRGGQMPPTAPTAPRGPHRSGRRPIAGMAASSGSQSTRIACLRCTRRLFDHHAAADGGRYPDTGISCTAIFRSRRARRTSVSYSGFISRIASGGLSCRAAGGTI